MPQLLGHFPLNISICLRALTLYHAVASPAAPAGAGGGKHGQAGGKGGQAALRVCDTLITLFLRLFYAHGQGGTALLQQVCGARQQMWRGMRVEQGGCNVYGQLCRPRALPCPALP